MARTPIVQMLPTIRAIDIIRNGSVEAVIVNANGQPMLIGAIPKMAGAIAHIRYKNGNSVLVKQP
jgi:hypothetical protein